MAKVILYSVLLILGMFISQALDLSVLQPHLGAITMVCLSYIMIEVGLEFDIDKKKLSSYGFDYLIAMTAAAFPWIFCAAYFYYVLNADLQDSLLIARFAAPTSAGVLFAMLAAAGLGATWLFHKARVLAIFDDLDTILFMIPLQMVIVGFRKEIFVLLVIIFLLFFFAYHFLHKLKIPSSGNWLLFYGLLVVGFCELVEETTNVSFEVLLPAFALGCMIYNPHNHKPTTPGSLDHAYLEPRNSKWQWLDSIVKNGFMFLVGCSLPKIYIGTMGPWWVAGHVAILTVLSNIGKMFPSLCYRKEASFRERVAVSVAMFPRGEVGAGVLLIAMEYELNEQAISLGALSLALNLALTGLFIMAVIKLNGSAGQSCEKNAPH